MNRIKPIDPDKPQNRCTGLIDGTVVKYHAASLERKPPSGPATCPCLGKGVVHSVNGQFQDSEVQLHFWGAPC